jgi:hypothetical protein
LDSRALGWQFQCTNCRNSTEYFVILCFILFLRQELNFQRWGFGHLKRWKKQDWQSGGYVLNEKHR